MKNWWHVRCVHFISKLLMYKQLWLSYSKISVLIFATFQFFMFWFKTDFVKWKLQFRNSLFHLKWKNEFQKISTIFQIWLKHWKRKKEKKFFWLYFNLKPISKNKNQSFRIPFSISNQKMNFKKSFHFSILFMKLKNEKWTIFNFVLFLKQKTNYTFGTPIVNPWVERDIRFLF